MSPVEIFLLDFNGIKAHEAKGSAIKSKSSIKSIHCRLVDKIPPLILWLVALPPGYNLFVNMTWNRGDKF